MSQEKMWLTILELALVFSLLARMLRIWQMSGQELPAVSTERILDVQDLKASLSLDGFPICMQQLLHNGKSLNSFTKLDAPMDLQLVLLPLLSNEQ